MQVIIRPLITEKMTADSEKHGRYGFVVTPKAGKDEIRKAVEAQYGVNVTGIHTMNYSGKRKTRYTKAGIIHGKTNAFKKAIVEVAEGQVIDFYSNI